MDLSPKLILILLAVSGVKACVTPDQGDNLYFHCSLGNDSVPCSGTLRTGTSVKFLCSEFWQLDRESYSEIVCLGNGNWSHPPPRCIPICGKISSAVPLIVNGMILPRGVFPWHAALYHRDGDDKWAYQCGASLVSAWMVLTAAHCTFLTEPENVKIALGKTFREAEAPGDNSSMIPVHSIEILETYQDAQGNYNGDLAILLLSQPAVLSSTVAPICYDPDETLLMEQLKEGNTGIAIGWGLTENDTFSDDLRAVRMPVLSDEYCIHQQNPDFKKYVTYTTFCAGHTNGTGVCNGDSGGGLAFLDPKTDKWYIQGVVSVSPRRRGTPYCDPTHYSVFTKVARFGNWVRDVRAKELALEAEYFNISST